MLIPFAQSRGARRAPHQPDFMAISHTCLPCLPSERISPTCILVPLMIRLIRNDGSVEVFFFGQYGFIYGGSCGVL